METASNHRATAKAFVVQWLPMLTDSQYQRVITALATQLEYAYTIGLRDGKAEKGSN